MRTSAALAVAFLICILAGALPRAIAGQARTALTPVPAPGVAVMRRPGSTLVAVTLVIPAGSADDPDSIPGAARLVGEAVVQAVRWRLDPDAAQLNVRVERAWTAYTLLSSPELWVRSWAVLEDVAFRISLADAPLEAARTALLGGFAFEVGAPVREFERELYYVLGGAKDPWSRDPRGTRESVRKATPIALEQFREGHYRLAQATAAVVGPVTEQEARDALAPVGSGPLTRPANNGLAWRRGDRLPLRRDVTNSWIGAAFPAARDPDLPRTQLEFLAFQLQESLNPSPPDPGVFSVLAHIVDTPPGPVLVVEAAVMPEVAETWERRILAAVAKLESESDDTFFRWQRRRFRSATLLREGQPEEAALRMALDLARDGKIRPLQDEVWAIGPDDLAEASDELGAPRVLVMGPELTR
ncbi:MAG: insulinase family protein [Gemmatimonadetes bacterium]|nr:insulinase family protein [Gemmatimonadota bacterium]